MSQKNFTYGNGGRLEFAHPCSGHPDTKKETEAPASWRSESGHEDRPGRRTVVRGRPEAAAMTLTAVGYMWSACICQEPDLDY